MATQMFEGKGHAAVYQKYRFAPGKELQQTILTYLQEKVSGVWPGSRKKQGSGICGSVTLVGATRKNKLIGLKARSGHRRAFLWVVPC